MGYRLRINFGFFRLENSCYKSCDPQFMPPVYEDAIDNPLTELQPSLFGEEQFAATDRALDPAAALPPGRVTPAAYRAGEPVP